MGGRTVRLATGLGVLALVTVGCADGRDTSATETTPQEPLSSVPTTELPTLNAPDADFVGKWVGHTRSLQLNDDGSGEISLFSGVRSGEDWTVQWDGSGSGISLTMVSRNRLVGLGVGDLSPGQTWSGHLVNPEQGGRAILLNGVGYCDPAANATGYCGT